MKKLTWALGTCIVATIFFFPEIGDATEESLVLCGQPGHLRVRFPNPPNKKIETMLAMADSESLQREYKFLDFLDSNHVFQDLATHFPGHEHCLEALNECGAAVGKITDVFHNTGLHYAAFVGDVPLIEALSKHSNFLRRNKQGQKPLVLATMKNKDVPDKSDAIIKLLEYAKPAIDEEFDPRIHAACNGYVRGLKALLAAYPVGAVDEKFIAKLSPCKLLPEETMAQVFEVLFTHLSDGDPSEAIALLKDPNITFTVKLDLGFFKIGLPKKIPKAIYPLFSQTVKSLQRLAHHAAERKMDYLRDLATFRAYQLEGRSEGTAKHLLSILRGLEPKTDHLDSKEESP